jgi:hypothetical protein
VKIINRVLLTCGLIELFLEIFMKVTFYHTGPAHNLVMTMIQGESCTLVNAEKEALVVTPRVDDEDFSVAIVKDGPTKKVTVPVRLSGSLSGNAIMTLRTYVCDEGFENPNVPNNRPSGLIQFWSNNGRPGPCAVNFE